jgi:DNA polymerase-3 subunit gamma/tau
VRFEDGRLEIALEPSAPKTLVHDLSRKFSQWTNRRWMVIVSAEPGEPTLKSKSDARRAELKTGVQADPLVAAVLARFPGAEIVEVRPAEVARAAVRSDDDAPPETGGDDEIV